MTVGGVNHITLASGDVASAVAFYVGVLGCRLVARWPAGAYLVAGSTWLAIVEGLPESRPRDDYSHVALDVAGHDFADLARRIVDSGTEVWQDNWTEGDSLYFLDPDGHKLEIHATSLAERLRSAAAAPWPGLSIDAGAALAATTPPSVADRRKPRRLSCAPLGVFVVVVRSNDEVLLLRAPGEERYEVPNGAVEAREDPTDAARRELHEEVGSIEVGELVCFSARTVVYDPLLPDLVSIGFVCRYESGEPVPGDDMAGSEVRWMGLGEAASVRLAVPESPDVVAAAVAALGAR